jgi:hypothetical protein
MAAASGFRTVLYAVFAHFAHGLCLILRCIACATRSNIIYMLLDIPVPIYTRTPLVSYSGDARIEGEPRHLH